MTSLENADPTKTLERLSPANVLVGVSAFLAGLTLYSGIAEALRRQAHSYRLGVEETQAWGRLFLAHGLLVALTLSVLLLASLIKGSRTKRFKAFATGVAVACVTSTISLWLIFDRTSHNYCKSFAVVESCKDLSDRAP